jgi:tRNA (cmo5U34)-methyltransferase
VQSIRIAQGYAEATVPLVQPAQLILCVLTSMFLPIDSRATFFLNCYESLAPGGALLIVDKLQAAESATQRLLTETYHDFKRAQGYSGQAVQDKARALKGVLVPVPEATQLAWLRSAGPWKAIEGFFRAYTFAGYVCMKQ